MENARYAYSPINERPPLVWPGNARVAFWVVPNIEHFRFDDQAFGGPKVSHVPAVPSFSERDYGNRVGVWRLMEVLDKHGLRATVALNSDVTRYEPEIIRAGNERQWEWMGHGQTNSSRLTGLDETAERKLIEETVETIAQTTGTRPRGWLGPGRQETFRTPDLLAEAGLSYVSDWSADDEPIPLSVQFGQIIALPYSGISDKSAEAKWSAEQFYRTICDQFDVLYEEAARRPKVLSVALHPYLSGRPDRTSWLDKALKYITGHDSVWSATGAEIVDAYLRQRGSAQGKTLSTAQPQWQEDR